MKRLLQVLFLGASLAIAGTILYYGGLIGLYAVSVVFGRDTAYAPSYTEEKFAFVRKGMTRADVEALVGKGHWTSDDGAYVHYTHSPTGTHFDQRLVIYQGDRVVAVRSEIYFD